METAFARALRENNVGGLYVDMYLINSRGGPWFGFSAQAIEDLLRIRLQVISVDQKAKIIKWKPIHLDRLHPQMGIITTPRLYRRNELDRMEWSVKMRINTIQGPVMKPRLCTLIAPDTQIESKFSKYSISTYDMQFFYHCRDCKGIQNNACDYLDFNIDSFECSYSYYFSKMDNQRHEEYGSWSVHASDKRDYLLQLARDTELEWKDIYWNFDLVLHWLTLGNWETASSVIEFLLEHEKQYAILHKRQPVSRYFRSESIEF